MKSKILNKKNLFILIAFFSVVSVIYIFLKMKPATKTIPTPDKLTNYGGLIPGVSTKNDVLTNLGQPQNELPDETGTLEYKSQSPNRQNTVGIENSKVSLVKEVVTLKDSKTANDITSVYGIAKDILYGPDAEAGFNLYVYPEDGIAYVGHTGSGLLLEIWYFPPTDIKSFIAKYTTNYSTTREIRQ